VNPAGRLVQTEDLGKTFSTPRLSYQATFDNERRWLTFDLLSGRLRPGEPMWNYCTSGGVTEHELEWFADNSCPPDILGVNHYLTSDRFLDENIDRYPFHTHGGNSRHRYADVEAVRVESSMELGSRARLLEIWNRYRRPLAVTEVHVGCSVDEQMRWFHQTWNGCQHLRDSGVEIQAVTAWALLGSFDWNSLLVRNDNVYEPGVFDLRGGQPKSSGLADMLRELAAGNGPSDPQVYQPGWWQRPERIFYRAEEFTPTKILESSSATCAPHF
jgi:dTDP-4-dehydrorhamnose reductase